MLPARTDGYLTTAEAASLAGVKPGTIRQWRNRGWLAAQGLDERGYPVHSREAVRAAEKRVRENGLQTSGIDPRQLRDRPAFPVAA
jgi:DNA-binding transcriptional MerR regulator